MLMHSLLIVHRDHAERERMSGYFREKRFPVEGAPDAGTAELRLARRAYSLVYCDASLPEDEIERLVNVTRHMNSLCIVSAEPQDSDSTVDLLDDGAFDIIQKPFSYPALEARIRKALEMKTLRLETASLRGERNIIYRVENLIGNSPKIRDVYRTIEKVAKSASSVLLTGETGTGKELVAGAIHYNSLRADRPFIKVNCAALPETLLESELFGHERGAFTGAEKQRIGRFEQADGGSIFLDEIGDMTFSTQAKILRVLQEKEFQRVGGNKTIRVDVRIISATNRNLEQEIINQQFRDDLFYRLNVITIHMPPLRERMEDIPLLAVYFLNRYRGDLKKRVVSIDPQAMDLLVRHEWPGNIRELQNTIERAVIMTDGEVIMPDDLQLPASRQRGTGQEAPSGDLPIGITLHEMEHRFILLALERSGWVQKRAAALLGVSERVLNYKIRHFGIVHPTWRRNR